MNQRKPNRIMWYSLGLALLLCAAFLVTSTGTAFARYRTEREKNITFEVREPERICLGTLAEDGSFAVTDPVWKTVDDVHQLDLAVANGNSADDYSRQDQIFYFRLIGSAGLEDTKVYLHLPAEDSSAEETKLLATASPIVEGTALYHAYGAGWIYTFQDTEGEELSWTLAGSEFQFVSLTVTIDKEPAIASLIHPQVIGEVVGG